MDHSQLPSGRYLSITIDVHPDYGGQTRALLMRNRILAAHGADTRVLSVGPAPDMDWRRQTLRERGLLSEGLDLTNIYEHYRDTDWEGDAAGDGDAPSDAPLEDLGRHLRRETTRADGEPWRRTYTLGDGRTFHDYLRPDGTTFLRMPRFVFKEPSTWPDAVTRVSRDGQVVGTYRSLAGWYRRWIRDLAGDERTFVFMDSRYLVPHVAPMKAPHVHLIYQMHNIHVGGERRWDGPTGPVYERVLERVSDLDAFVTLTERQGDDVAMRRGRTSNMFVVPNPVDMPEAPETVERDPRLVSVVARLEGQKRISHAIRAMEHVVREVPDARLEIYGRGSRTDGLQKVVDRLGLGGSVTLKGHDPHARQALWQSSAFLMTSLFEGYPLSTLESMSHGCPVVSYDIKYGPREQISEGVDGFLVEPGDTETMAARVVQLLRDPDLVRRMSDAARDKAAHHGYDRFIADWTRVLHAVAEAKPRRTRIVDAALEVQRLTVGRDPGPGRFGGRKRLRLEATLTVTGRGAVGTLPDATVSLAAVHEGSGVVAEVPLDVHHRDGAFRLKAAVPLDDLYPEGSADQDAARLRVTLTWANSAWSTWVERPAGGSGLEVDYVGDTWTLVRR